MTIESLFPTEVYHAPLKGRGADTLRAQLLRECRQLRRDDPAGRRWSNLNYPGGYTSYASANRMHTVSPTFADLERRLAPHVRRFVKALELDLTRRTLEMTDCWVNIMPPGVVHGLHLHPLSTLSGTFYVQTPRGSPGLKLEDPRLDRMMAAPPRRRDAARGCCCRSKRGSSCCSKAGFDMKWRRTARAASGSASASTTAGFSANDVSVGLTTVHYQGTSNP